RLQPRREAVRQRRLGRRRPGPRRDDAPPRRPPVAPRELGQSPGLLGRRPDPVHLGVGPHGARLGPRHGPTRAAADPGAGRFLGPRLAPRWVGARDRDRGGGGPPARRANGRTAGAPLNTTPLNYTEPSGYFVRIKSLNKTFTPELSPEVLQ